MQALTLHQPWAWAIAHSDKRIENRSWSPPDGLIGKYLAIHAGVLPRTKAMRAEMMETSAALDGPDKEDGFVFGAIVAVARVVRVLDKAPGMDSPHFEWWVGPFAWELDSVVALPTFVPARGQQGLWPLSPDELAEVKAQYRAAQAEVDSGQ